MAIEDMLSSEEALGIMLKEYPMDHAAERNDRIKKTLFLGAGAAAASVIGAIAFHYAVEYIDISLKLMRFLTTTCSAAGGALAYPAVKGALKIYNFMIDTTNFFIPGERDGEIYYRDGQFTDTANMLDVTKGYSVTPISYLSELESNAGQEYYFANGVEVLGEAEKLTGAEKAALGVDKSFWKVPAEYNGQKMKLLIDGTPVNSGLIRHLEKGDLLYCLGDYRRDGRFMPVADFGAAISREK